MEQKGNSEQTSQFSHTSTSAEEVNSYILQWAQYNQTSGDMLFMQT